MTQDEKWQARYNEVMGFLEENHRNPSRHRIEEHDHLNWLKANRKVMNAGKMKVERVEKFRKLLELTEQYKRKNQYE
jgi:hypothetical protein